MQMILESQNSFCVMQQLESLNDHTYTAYSLHISCLLSTLSQEIHKHLYLSTTAHCSEKRGTGILFKHKQYCHAQHSCSSISHLCFGREGSCIGIHSCSLPYTSMLALVALTSKVTLTSSKGFVSLIVRITNQQVCTALYSKESQIQKASPYTMMQAINIMSHTNCLQYAWQKFTKGLRSSPFCDRY